MPGFERLSILCHYAGGRAVLNADLLYRRIEDDVDLALQMLPDIFQHFLTEIRTDVPDTCRNKLKIVSGSLLLEARQRSIIFAMDLAAGAEGTINRIYVVNE